MSKMLSYRSGTVLGDCKHMRKNLKPSPTRLTHSSRSLRSPPICPRRCLPMFSPDSLAKGTALELGDRVVELNGQKIEGKWVQEVCKALVSCRCCTLLAHSCTPHSSWQPLSIAPLSCHRCLLSWVAPTMSSLALRRGIAKTPVHHPPIHLPWADKVPPRRTAARSV